jgi:hypothetical protein
MHLRCIVASMAAAEEIDDDTLSWNAPSPRLRVLRRYEVLTGTLVLIVLAAAVTIALGADAGAVGAVVGLSIIPALADHGASDFWLCRADCGGFRTVRRGLNRGRFVPIRGLLGTKTGLCPNPGGI